MWRRSSWTQLDVYQRWQTSHLPRGDQPSKLQSHYCLSGAVGFAKITCRSGLWADRPQKIQHRERCQAEWYYRRFRKFLSLCKPKLRVAAPARSSQLHTQPWRLCVLHSWSKPGGWLWNSYVSSPVASGLDISVDGDTSICRLPRLFLFHLAFQISCRFFELDGSRFLFMVSDPNRPASFLPCASISR